jgi:hypothetical protein
VPPRAHTEAPGMTRRHALRLGAGAGLAVMFGRIPAALAAAGSDDDVEAYLRRSGYAPLVGQAFSVAGAVLVLRAVEDLEHLPGRDDAFRLEFTGAAGAVETGTREFSHPALGPFDLFVAPVCLVASGVQRYEVVIDRSVKLPRNPPGPAVSAAAAAAVASVPAKPAIGAAAAAAAKARKRAELLRREKRRALLERKRRKAAKAAKRKKRRQAKTAS